MKKLIFIFVLSVNILSAQEILRVDNSISSISYSGTHFLHNWDATNDNITGLIELNDNQILKIGVIAKVKDFKSGNSSLDSNSYRVLDALRIPNIIFRSTKIVDSINVINVSGTISFHGIEKDLNVRQAENLVRKKVKKKSRKQDKEKKQNTTEDEDIFILSVNLSKKFGIKVVLENTVDGGKMSFHYSNLEELDSILSKIK